MIKKFTVEIEYTPYDDYEIDIGDVIHGAIENVLESLVGDGEIDDLQSVAVGEIE